MYPRLGPNGIPEEPTKETVARWRKQDQKQRAEFLKGPIPLDWLSQAGSLPCAALRVGLVLWFEVGRRRSTTIRLGPGLLGKLNIPRTTGQRGLKALEAAGLVTVERHTGRCPTVSIRGVE